MNTRNPRAYILFVIALAINAFGIAFITRALLGTSPITSITYVASMFTPLTMGQWTIVLNLLFAVLELPFMTKRQLREDLRMYLTQVVISLFFGLCIDLCMFIIQDLNPVAYVSKIVNLLTGCIILAVGIALEVMLNTGSIGLETACQLVAGLYRKTNRDINKTVKC